MNEVIRHLIEKLPVVTDGAWGTQLLARGLVPGECPDSWNLLYPDRVEAVARSYVEVGSRVILTNTFQANRFALGRHGLSGKTVQLNRAGVEISRKVASTRVRVFGSMGPSGKILMMGEVSQEDLYPAETIKEEKQHFQNRHAPSRAVGLMGL